MMETSKLWGPWGPVITQRNEVTYCWCLNNAVVADLVSEPPPFPPSLVTPVPTAYSAFPVQLFLWLGSKSPTVIIFYSWRVSFHIPDLEQGHRNGQIGTAERTVTSSMWQWRGNGSGGWSRGVSLPNASNVPLTEERCWNTIWMDY